MVAAEAFELKWIVPPEGIRFVKVARGAGPRLAKSAIEGAAGRFDALMSVGLCGALDPSLKVGDIVVASDVNGIAAEQPDCPGVSLKGSLLSVDRIVDTAGERQKWFAAGYSAVEMEAAAVQSRAAELQVPFYCIRAVSDTADEEFSLDFNAARDSAGRIRVASLLMQAARRPVTIVPELLRLRRNADKAARASGAFIATCHF